MKFWIIPIAVGLIVGIGLVMLLPHHGVGTSGIVPFALHKGSAASAAASAPAISQKLKIGAVIVGILLAFVPNATVKQIGAGLSAAGISALFTDHGA